MKIFKQLLITAVLCVTCAGFAQAQIRAPLDTDVRLTGSTAYRANVHAAITHVLTSGFTFAYSGSTLGGSTYAIFHGTIGGNPVVIKTSWSGSEGGIQTVSAQLPVLYYDDSVLGTTGGQGNLGTPVVGTNGVTQAPHVAMSDSFQSSSAFFGQFRGTFYPTLTESPNSPVGIVPFKWVVSKTPPTGLTNITEQNARYLYSNGQMPLALFTGNNADEGFIVNACGRDPDSGTRLTFMAETHRGAQASVTQYAPCSVVENPCASGHIITTGGGAITAYGVWPASTVNGLSYPIGDGGYSSGGTLATAMTNTSPAGNIAIAYLGTNDANNTAIPGGAVELTYNGNLLGGNSGTDYNTVTALTEGKYTVWGYEHLYYPSGTTGVVKTSADAIAGQLLSTDAVVRIGSMQVGRQTDGGTVTANYF
jgi:hypothetical protein